MRYVIIMIITMISVSGCLRMSVDPIEVKPITLNINLKIDRQLDDFFAFEKELRPALTTAPATAPVTVPASSATQPMDQ